MLMGSPIKSQHMSLGRALWGTHALWAIVLDAWGRQNERPGEGFEAWGGVEFDKLAHFLHLVWSRLLARSLVSFPSAYESADGVHGPGPAMERRDMWNRHVPALDAISHIQDALRDNPDVLLFDLRLRSYRGKKHYKVFPGRERSGQLPLHLSGSLPPGFQDRDNDFVNAVIAVVNDLSQEEIRALGTHQSKTQTIEAIEYNVFIHLFRRMMDEVSRIEQPSCDVERRSKLGQSDLPSLESVVDEIERKSWSNKAAYAAGWKKVCRKAKEGVEVAQVVIADKVFDDPDRIWEKEVTDWRAIGKQMADLHAYVKVLRNIYCPPVERNDPEAKQRQRERLENEHEEGRLAAGRIASQFGCIVPPVPRGCHESFDWAALRRLIVWVFDSLPGVTYYRRERYEEIARRFRQ